jgi:hypothetical protein
LPHAWTVPDVLNRRAPAEGGSIQLTASIQILNQPSQRKAMPTCKRFIEDYFYQFHPGGCI